MTKGGKGADVKSIVVYHSKYGSTREYAEWIGAETGAEVVALKEAKGKDLAGYDAVAFGCPFYAGKLKIAEFVMRVAPGLSGKRLAFFAVTARPAGDAGIVTDYERAVPEEIRKGMRFFALPGRIRFSVMNVFERGVMKMMKATELDRVDRKEINGLVGYLKGE
jgi:menaquinone-dependent protoporphyrinogen IX oxidase